jgi:peptidyl-prolyl cis-trans isomerase C
MTTASARHILVDTESECQALIQQIEDGASFETLARQHSKCPSGARGGELGSFGRGMMVPEFDAVVFEGELGKALGPVKTQFGYHVVEITERSG